MDLCGWICIAIIPVIDLSDVNFVDGSYAADPAANWTDKNFNPAKKCRKRIPTIPVSALRIAKGNVKVRTDGHEHCRETLTVTPPDSGPFLPPLQPHLPHRQVAHDFLGAAADGDDLDLAVHALDDISAQIAGAAEDLHGLAAHEFQRLGRMELGLGDFRHRHPVLVDRPADPVQQRLDGVDERGGPIR